MKSGILAFFLGMAIGLPVAVGSVEAQEGGSGLLPKPKLQTVNIGPVEWDAEEAENQPEFPRKRRPENAVEYFYTEEEKALLMALSQAEAGNQGAEGMALVMNVVNNRIASESFPDTLEGVIFQEGQFQPAGMLKSVEPGEEAWEALWMVQHGWNESREALYFEADWVEGSFQQQCCEFLFQKGGHKFYR